MNRNADQLDRKLILKNALSKIEELEARLEATERIRAEPIAVIGIGCRFPGGVSGPESFWRLLRDGTDAITEVPSSRWDLERHYDPDPNALGKTYSKFGGYLDDIDKFDPKFFGISPREAISVDPQHRLFLEVAWEALENAGQAPDKLKRSQTGVYVGVTSTEYAHLQTKYLEPVDVEAYTISNNVLNVASGRLSHFLGLHGPAISVDTACSSSQTALHLACQGLKLGDCDMAIVGGVNVILLPETYISFSKWGMFSRDGRCRTFDAGADGFVRSEGCGAVILKPLSAALANRDHILAVIRGTAANQDGPASGISVPNGLAQQQVIRRALENSGVRAEEVSYVETHGTGTTLGDPIEVEALAAVYGKDRSNDHPLRIGSVKTNLGHMESASGIAGLIKAVLALYHEEIPPHLHLERLSPHMPWDDLPITVPTRRTPWPRADVSRFAAVSSFGFSGTNAHVILEEAPAPPERQHSVNHTTRILTLSAKSEQALNDLAESYAEYFSNHPSLPWQDVCGTANSGRSDFSYRLAVVADSLQQARQRLSGKIQDGEAPGVLTGLASSVKRQKVALLYPGQGCQYTGMGRDLFEREPVFRDALQKCDRLFEAYLNGSLLSIIYPDIKSSSSSGFKSDAALIDQTFYTQPAIFAIQYALTELWRSWGVTPDVVLGHSLGEFMAAHVAGVYSLEDGVKLVAERGRITDDIPTLGIMASLQAPYEEVVEMIGTNESEICVAAVNGPKSIVVAGTKDKVDEVVKLCESRDLSTRVLPISNAFHSPFIEPALDQFEKTASEVTFAVPRLRLISTLTGRSLPPKQTPNARYWRRHLREPVQFFSAMKTLAELDVENFIEIGPHPTMLTMGQQCIPDEGRGWFPSLRKDYPDKEQLLESVGGLHVRGVKIDLQKDESSNEYRRVWLPTYPFQRERYWIEERKPRASRRKADAALLHPFLGECAQSPVARDIVIQSELCADELPYLEDHRVHDMVIFPLTGHLEMILAGAREVLAAESYALEDVVLGEPLILPDDGHRKVQLVLSPEDDKTHSFKLITIAESDEKAASYQLHVTGKIISVGPQALEGAGSFDVNRIKQRCQNEISVNQYYQDLYQRGLQFGPSFRGVDNLWRQDGESLGLISCVDEISSHLGDYHFHPALLDACLQVVVASWPDDDELRSTDTYLPLNLQSYNILRRPTGRLWSHVRLYSQHSENQETYTCDVSISDSEGRLVAELKGLVVKRTSAEAIQNALMQDVQDWLYEIEWRAQELPVAESPEIVRYQMPAVPILAETVRSTVPSLCAQEGVRAYDKLLPELDKLCSDFILHTFSELGWKPIVDQAFALDSVLEELGVDAKHQRLVDRMLNILQEDGIIEKENEEWRVKNLPSPSEPGARLRDLLEANQECDAELMLLERCAPNLASVLKGEMDPLQLLFPNGSLELLEKVYQHAPVTQLLNRLAEKAVARVVESLPADKPLRILEVGAGTGGTTAFLLPRLPSNRTEYTFTDVSPQFLNQAKQKFADFPFVNYRLLDIERDPASQDLPSHQFDIVIAANVLHATSDLRTSLGHVKQLLAPEGLAVLLEGIAQLRWVDLTFGLTEGWWKFSDTDLRPNYALLSDREWLSLLTEMEFRQAEAISGAGGDDMQAGLTQHALILAGGPPSSVSELSNQTGDGFLILADEGGLGEKLAAEFELRNHHCVLATAGDAFEISENAHCTVNPESREDFTKLLKEAFPLGKAKCRGVIHLWNLDLDAADELKTGQLENNLVSGSASLLHLSQALIGESLSDVPSLWVVTRGAQRTTDGQSSVAPDQACAWGLGKVIALEHPELRCVRVDLDSSEPSTQCKQLFDEIRLEQSEDQVAFRGGERFVARLARSKPQKASISANGVESLRLQTSKPGVLNGLGYRPSKRRRPAPEEVQICVRATGLNFRDVLNALDMYPGDAGPLGGECSGTISAVGEKVDNFKVGDAVVAIAPGSFGTYVTTHENLVVPKLGDHSFEEGATILSAFMTAHHTLIELGELNSNDKILIHAASGGVGMAAVQLAQQIGAEIFATAGSPKKREYLKSLGIKHVMDSRTLKFADEIMTATKGRGVDIVLNCLSGEFIQRSLSALSENGRFLEIGKKDIWTSKQVADYKASVLYYVVDLAADAKEEPARIRSILNKIMAGFEDGELKPLPQTTFESGQVEEAFRYMQQAKHIGKIVVRSPNGEAGKKNGAVNHACVQNCVAFASVGFSPDATYLITGGLAGLGLLTAKWMVERGARHLVLMGRSEPASASKDLLLKLEQAGARILVWQGDVSKESDVSDILSEIQSKMPALRGIVHSAGVLDDGALPQQTWGRFTTVLAPKTKGAWLLHNLTEDMPLDFFVLYSSVASLLGSRGQANHASANAFLDALAHYRRANGKPGLSIHWGAWSDIGAAAERKVGERLTGHGIGTISPQKGLKALERVFQNEVTEIGVLPINWTAYVSRLPSKRTPAFLSQVMPKKAAMSRKHEEQGPTILQQVRQAPPNQRGKILRTFLQSRVAKVLNLQPGQILDKEQPLHEVGMDSLMAVELRNEIGSGLGVKGTLPATLLFDHPTIQAVSDYLVSEVLSKNGSNEPEKRAEATDAEFQEIEQLSDEEADSLLLQELAEAKG